MPESETPEEQSSGPTESPLEDEAQVMAKASSPYRSRAALEKQTIATNRSGISGIQNELHLRHTLKEFEEAGMEDDANRLRDELSRIEQEAKKARVPTHSQLDKIYPAETTDRTGFTSNITNEELAAGAVEAFKSIADKRERWAQILHRNPSAEAEGWDVEKLIQTEETILQLEKETGGIDDKLEKIKDAIGKDDFNIWTDLFLSEEEGGFGFNGSNAAEDARDFVFEEFLHHRDKTMGNLQDAFVARMEAHANEKRTRATDLRRTLDKMIKTAFPDQQTHPVENTQNPAPSTPNEPQE